MLRPMAMRCLRRRRCRYLEPLRAVRHRLYSSLTPPLVDVRSFYHGTADAMHEHERRAAAAAASRACREHGLLALPAYGGIPPHLVSGAFVAIKGLFGLPIEQKMELEYRSVRENVGYIQEGLEHPDPEEAAADPKEVFQFQPGKRDLPSALEQPLAALFDAGMASARATLRCLARALQLPDDETFARATQHLDLCGLRAIHYPGGVAPLANRCGAHSDFGLCTLLLNEVDGPPGLQAQDVATREWRNVEPPAGAREGGVGVAFVNVGQMLSRWTNDEVHPTRHRVVAPAEPAKAARSRFVIALFCDADARTPLDVLPQFTASRPPRYPPILAGDFKAMLLSAQTDV